MQLCRIGNQNQCSYHKFRGLNGLFSGACTVIVLHWFGRELGSRSHGPDDAMILCDLMMTNHCSKTSFANGASIGYGVMLFVLSVISIIQSLLTFTNSCLTHIAYLKCIWPKIFDLLPIMFQACTIFVG